MNDLDQLIRVFLEIDDPKTMRRFFDEIFTEAERKDFALRWKLMQMLREKVPQRKIASTLKISLCKITRGARIINDSGSVTNRVMAQRTRKRRIVE